MEWDVDGGETMIANAQFVPFYWSELEEVNEISKVSAYLHILHSLPEGGWDTVVSRGTKQYFVREGLPPPSLPASAMSDDTEMVTCHTTNKPNALCALYITVRADRRNLGLAEQLIEAMQQAAREECLRLLVVPLRLTRKSEYPWISMEEYISYTVSEPPPSKSPTSSEDRASKKSTHLDHAQTAFPSIHGCEKIFAKAGQLSGLCHLARWC